MKKTKRLDGRKKCITFTKRLKADMRSYCRGKGIESQSELVRQAMGKYIYADYKDETLKLQGLKQLEEKVAKLKDMMELFFNYMDMMHSNILAYHPEIDTQLADAAFRSATMRRDKFFNVFQNSLKDNPPFFERLLHKYFSEETDGQN